jgi:hypothetical protein
LDLLFTKRGRNEPKQSVELKWDVDHVPPEPAQRAAAVNQAAAKPAAAIK